MAPDRSQLFGVAGALPGQRLCYKCHTCAAGGISAAMLASMLHHYLVILTGDLFPPFAVFCPRLLLFAGTLVKRCFTKIQPRLALSVLPPVKTEKIPAALEFMCICVLLYAKVGSPFYWTVFHQDPDRK